MYVPFLYSATFTSFACFLRLFLLLSTWLHLGGGTTSFPGSLSLGTGMREPWERGWRRESFRKTPEDWEIIFKKVTMGYGIGSH